MRYLDFEEVMNSCIEKQKASYTILVLLLALLFASCRGGPHEGQVDKSFITGQPCSPPCWYGLYLDESDEQEVRATLADLEFIDQSRIREWGAVWFDDKAAKEVHWSCYMPNETLCGGALLSVDKLKRLWMVVGFELLMTDVIETHGQPEYIDYGPTGTEVMGCAISFYWPEKLIYISSNNDYSECQELEKSGKLDPEILATTIMYFSREGFDTEPCSSCTRIEWPGFKD